MNFTLRKWKKSDINSLVHHANDYDIAKYLNDQFPYPYTKDCGRSFIQMAALQKPTQIFAIDIDGKAVGALGIHIQDGVLRKNAEIGYWLGREYWGRGIMSLALPMVVDYAFKTFDITRIFARVFEGNAGSIHVLKKNGFKMEAKFEKTIFKNGVFFDEYIFAIRKHE